MAQEQPGSTVLGELEQYPTYQPPSLCNTDRWAQTTKKNPEKSLLEIDPLDPPKRKVLIKLRTFIPPIDGDDDEDLREPTPPPPTPSMVAAPTPKPAESMTQASTVIATNQAKRARKPLPQSPVASQQKKKASTLMAQSTTTASANYISIPRRGPDFPDTGFRPAGQLVKNGSLKGHLRKADCRGPVPSGCTPEEWAKKFRSAESVLKKQLDRKLKDKKAAKEQLDDMRDDGWVSDRTLYMWDQEHKKKLKAVEEGEEDDDEGEEEDEAEAEADDEDGDEDMMQLD